MQLDKKICKSQRAYELAQREYGTGSRAQQLTQAITAAMQGALSGDIGSALGGAAAPYVAEYVKTHTDAGAERIISHAVAGAVLAELQQGNALAGATGAGLAAGGAEYLASQLYPGKNPSSLSEAEKQTVAALTTLAASIVGGLTGGDLSAAVDGGKAGRNEVENNFLHVDEALAFDKEMQSCRATGGDCSSVIEKYQKISDERSAELDTKCAADPVMCQGWDKELAYGSLQAVERPEWMGDIFGLDVMRSDEAKAYVQYWNSVDLAKIDTNSAAWAKFAVFISDPEMQAALVSGGLLSKDIIKLATATASNIHQGGVLASIKSMQIGLRNPQQVDQIKKDMLSGDYRFTAPEGRIAGYVDSKGTYYISEGNHRMVAAQEIYKKTGDASYTDNLLKDGVRTQTKNAPAGAKPMSKR